MTIEPPARSTSLHRAVEESDDAEPSEPPSDVSSTRVDRPSRVKGAVIARRYRLVSLLGEGGMGTVWTALDLHLDIEVAIKLLRLDASGADAARRLKQEARATARLVHPSVVRILDFGKTAWGDPFIVMELLRGELLSTMMDRDCKLLPTQSVAVILPILSALVSAHNKGVVHRDLKPENIFLCATDVGTVIPKILDFGIARFREAGSLRLTGTNTVMGTPDYMSPEQARGLRDSDERTDVWAMTVMLYECLCSSRPFEELSYNALMLAIQNDAPVPTHELGVGDEDLWRIIERGLAKDRDKRWQGVGDLGRALAAWGVNHGMLHDISGGALDVHWPQQNARAASGTFAVREQVDEEACALAMLPTMSIAPKASASNLPEVEALPLPGISASNKRWKRGLVVACLFAASFVAFALGRGSGANEDAPGAQNAGPPVSIALSELQPLALAAVLDVSLPPATEPGPPPTAEPVPVPSVQKPAAPKQAAPRPTRVNAESTLPPRAPNF